MAKEYTGEYRFDISGYQNRTIAVKEMYAKFQNNLKTHGIPSTKTVAGIKNGIISFGFVDEPSIRYDLSNFGRTVVDLHTNARYDAKHVEMDVSAKPRIVSKYADLGTEIADYAALHRDKLINASSLIDIREKRDGSYVMNVSDSTGPRPADPSGSQKEKRYIDRGAEAEAKFGHIGHGYGSPDIEFE